MRRAELVRIARRLKPAIARKDFIPVFTCAYFDGKTVTAHNDVIAIQVPCDWEFKGGLRHKEFTKFLVASRSEEPVWAEMQEGSQCIISMGDTKLTLGVIPLEEFLFNWPTDTGDEIKPGDEFIDRLRQCAVTLGVDPSHPWRMGVTIAFDDDGVRFYSTDDHIMTAATLKRDVPGGLVGQAFVLPPMFVRELIVFDSDDPLVTINFCDGHVQAIFASGLKLWSRLIPEVDAGRYVRLTGMYDEADMLPIPPDFKGVLRRVASIDSPKDKHQRSSLRIVQDEHGASLEFVTLDRMLGKVTTRLPIDPEAVEIDLTSYATLLLKALPGMTEIGFFETGIALRGLDVMRAVSILAPNADADGDEPKKRIRRPTAGDRLRTFLVDLVVEPMMAADALQAIDKAGFKLSTETIAHVRRSCHIGTRKVKDGWEWFPAEAIQDQDQPLEKAG